MGFDGVGKDVFKRRSIFSLIFFYPPGFKFPEWRGPSWVSKWHCTHRQWEDCWVCRETHAHPLPPLIEKQQVEASEAHDMVVYQGIQLPECNNHSTRSWHGSRTAPVCLLESETTLFFLSCTITFLSSKTASTRNYRFKVFTSSAEPAAYGVCEGSRGNAM